MTENFIKNVVAAMQDSLTDEQLQKLDFPVYNISVYETPTNCSTYQEASL